MSQKDYDMVPRWYVVHTYSGYENKVKTDLEKTVKNRELEDFFFDIIVPMEEQIEIKEGQKKTNLKIYGETKTWKWDPDMANNINILKYTLQNS